MTTRRPSRLAMLLALPLFLAAALGCGGGSASTTAPPSPATGGMDITVGGVPEEVSAGIVVTGPGAYEQRVDVSTVLTDLVPGTYTLQTPPVVDGDWQYTPSQTTQHVTIAAGAPRPVALNYTAAQVRGRLAVSIDGLPAGADALIDVSGPGGYQQTITHPDTLRSLVPGAYSVTATMVAHEGTFYVPFPESDSVEVAEGNTAASFVTYSEQGTASTLDLWVDRIELVQSTQRDGGGVPLIRDRDALLRVYGLANEINLADPDVRVEIYVNGQLQQVEIASASSPTTPRAVDRGDLSASWNLVVPSALVQPNLGIRVEIDPDDRFDESEEGNNRFPLGTPLAIPVASIGALQVRLVPVVTPEAGQGNVDVGNADTFVETARRIYPFPDVDVDVRAPFTPTLSGPLQADGTGWLETLEQVNALRATSDRSTRYYYGVVATTYNSGVAGLGYVPNSRSQGYSTAVGWDKPNSRAGVMAHELGHNLGRPHSPCGNPANPDPGYPYPRASIGVWGYDPTENILKDPAEYTDIMGYCNPQWISDYTFEQVLSFMGASVVARASTATTCLLVWGNVIDGELTLRPSFLVRALPHVPARRGSYEVTAYDVDGAQLFRLGFDPVRVADLPGDHSTFAWTVPVSVRQAETISRLVLRGRGGESVRVSTSTLPKHPAAAPSHRLARRGPDRAVLEWDDQSYPMVMVRDPGAGEMLALLADGAAEFVALEGRGLELLFSDGVRSVLTAAQPD